MAYPVVAFLVLVGATLLWLGCVWLDDRLGDYTMWGGLGKFFGVVALLAVPVALYSVSGVILLFIAAMFIVGVGFCVCGLIFG